MLEKNKTLDIESDQFLDDLIVEAAQIWLSRKENKKDTSKYESSNKYQKTEKDEKPKKYYL